MNALSNCKNTVLVLETTTTDYKTATVLKKNSSPFKTTNYCSFVFKLQMKLKMT